MSTEDAMPGSHAANQSKTESMPPSQGHADPAAAPEPATVEVPSLDSMSVGAADPQAPNHPAAAAAGDRAASGVPALDAPVLGGSAPEGGRADAHDDAPPAVVAAGTAQRVPGSLGATGANEQVDTDVERSAELTDVQAAGAAGPGEGGGVPVTSDQPAPGSSQESGVVQGSRTPL